jgi:hypothetical protein
LSGWVRNQADGSVEVDKNGSAPIDVLVERLRRGPPGLGRGVEAAWSEGQALHHGFDVGSERVPDGRRNRTFETTGGPGRHERTGAHSLRRTAARRAASGADRGSVARARVRGTAGRSRFRPDRLRAIPRRGDPVRSRPSRGRARVHAHRRGHSFRRGGTRSPRHLSGRDRPHPDAGS